MLDADHRISSGLQFAPEARGSLMRFETMAWTMSGFSRSMELQGVKLQTSNQKRLANFTGHPAAEISASFAITRSPMWFFFRKGNNSKNLKRIPLSPASAPVGSDCRFGGRVLSAPLQHLNFLE
jgi:hypothetical protein